MGRKEKEKGDHCKGVRGELGSEEDRVLMDLNVKGRGCPTANGLDVVQVVELL